jgi:hypothetical protein
MKSLKEVPSLWLIHSILTESLFFVLDCDGTIWRCDVVVILFMKNVLPLRSNLKSVDHELGRCRIHYRKCSPDSPLNSYGKSPMSSLLPPMTFGRTENSIGKVGMLAPIHIRSPSVSPEGNRRPAPLLPLDDADEVETEDEDARTFCFP